MQLKEEKGNLHVLFPVMFCESRVGKQRTRHRLFPVSLCDGATQHTATISYAWFSLRPTLPAATKYITHSRCSSCALAMWVCKTSTPRSSCSSRPVEVQGGNGGKRNDATSIHLIVLGVLPKTRGDMCKMRVDSLHKTFR